MTLRLLGKAASINVRKVLWTCEEVGRAYLREDWGSGFAPTLTPEFLALNPNGLVPVIVDGDLVLWESNTICRYLAASAGTEWLLPCHPAARARVEQWMDWQATELNTAWRGAFMHLVRGHPARLDAAEVAGMVAGWNARMALLDRHLAAGGPYVAGEDFTLADIVLGLSTNRWLMTPMACPELPAVADWYARLKARPAFRRHGCNGIP
ncbi:glutathione S-transferase family protein [Paracraurococcus lichenis]|uniref:Glutathione S-transferase n=1 Tax=Paracraurococcus lichenis TaxID=3064888 RepID=A0ABT9EB99_9PROT|nr:glutathione S-transferase [Paracraurococcus sp. LOR1-02]MDO9713228.1 glutathione S-transferase [Paracraurococcus sp. LOR1-02]